MPQMSKVSRNNTAIVTENGKTSVILHSTKVVTFDDKTIKLDNGGWVTTTTQARMNQASNQYGLGFYVHRNNGAMILSYKGKTFNFDCDITFKR